MAAVITQYVVRWQRDGRGTWYARPPMKAGTTEEEALAELAASQGHAMGADPPLTYELLRITTEVVK
jgi:hypothetical protein